MNVAMMQPAFMPWQGFFGLIHTVDIFVFLDDFQFSVQSYHQRNRLFVNPGAVDWYSVPVRKSSSFKMPLSETRINDDIPWRKKTLKRIAHNYSRAPFFATIFPVVEYWLKKCEPSLGEQNMALILTICHLLGIRKEFRRSSRLPSEAARSQRVLELLRWCGASRYYSARGSFPYMLEDKVFPVEDIDVLFQDFHPQSYRQVGSPNEFTPSLSILDALFNVGPEETLRLVSRGTGHWNTWQEMSQRSPAI